MNGFDHHGIVDLVRNIMGRSGRPEACERRAHNAAVRHGSRALRAVVPTLAWLLAVGCIERTVTITTEPEGATVFLNDQDVGMSPVRAPFTWYGDYDIVIRKPGYETIRTNHRIDTPWYDLPGIDIITECFVPFTVHDDRVVDTFVMDRQQHPSDEALLQAADNMRQRVQNPEG